MRKPKERPILFRGEMVRGILDGRKTQTRRVIKPRPLAYTGRKFIMPDDAPKKWHNCDDVLQNCEYGMVGDRLRVRETWADVNTEEGPGILYRADGAFFQPEFDGKDYGAGPSYDYDKYPGDYTMWYEDLLRGKPEHRWKPSIFMPRWAGRINLEITKVHFELLHDISEEDAIKEGCYYSEQELATAADKYADLWVSINGQQSWDGNPWVWVVEFKRIDQ